MPKEVKFTEDELTKVQNIQKSYANVQQSFGQLKLAQIRLDGQEPEVEVIGDDVWLLEDEYNPGNMQKKLKDLINR